MRADRVEAGLQCVDPGFQRFHIGRSRIAACQQVLDRGFEAVRHLAQAHGTRQAGAALERVQGAHAGRRGACIAGLAHPFAHAGGQLRQQFLALFLEDREQLGIDRVDGVDVILVVERIAARRDGAALEFGQRFQCLEFGLAQFGQGSDGQRFGRHRVHRRERRRFGLGFDFRRQHQVSCRFDDRLGRHRGQFADGLGHGHPLERHLRLGDIGRQRLGDGQFLGRLRSHRLRHGHRLDLGHGERFVQRHLGREGLGHHVELFGGQGQRQLGVLGLRHGGQGLHALGRLDLVLGQALRQLGRHFLQEARGELVQQATDFLRRIGEQLRFQRSAAADGVRAHQRVLERTGQLRQLGEAHRGRIAGQRMRHRHGVLAHRAMQLQRPLGQLGAEAARQLVGFVEVDVEQRDADAQRPDHLELVGIHRLDGLDGRHFDDGRSDRRLFDRRHGGLHFGHRQLGNVVHHRQAEFGRLRLGRRGRRFGRKFFEGAEVKLDGLDRRRRGRGFERAKVEVEGHRRLAGSTQHGRGLGRRLGLDDRQLQRQRRLDQLARVGHGGHLDRRLVDLGDRHGQLVHRDHFGHGRQLQRLGRGQVGHDGGQRRHGLGSRGGSARQRHRLAARLHAHRIRRTADDFVVVAAGLAVGDGVDPVAQVGQDVVREAQQLLVGMRRIGQPGVVELFAGPGGLAEVGEADHARAALEGVEGTTHGRQLADVGAVVRQVGQGFMRTLHHLAGFLQEDLAHLGVVFQAGGSRSRGGRRGRHGCGDGGGHRSRGHHGHGRRGSREFGRQGGGVGGGVDEVGHHLGQLFAHGLALLFVLRVLERRMGRADGLGQHRLVGHQGLVRQALQVARDLLDAHLGVGRGQGQVAGLLDQAGLGCGRRGRRCGRRLGLQRCEAGVALALAHHGAQAAGLGVELEQRLRQLRLHAEHVDQEPERTQVACQAVEGAGLGRALRVDLGRHHGVDFVAHADDGLRRLLHAQHGQHAAHGLQLARHRDEHAALGRVAEELVDELLGLGQGRAQFLHHAAHGLPVGDAAIQLLHPAFERLGGRAGAHALDALRQALHARGFFGMVELAVLEGGVEVQDRGGHFHRQLGAGRLAAGHGLLHSGVQGIGELVARGQQALERIGDQRELFSQPVEAVEFTARDG